MIVIHVFPPQQDVERYVEVRLIETQPDAAGMVATVRGTFDILIPGGNPASAEAFSAFRQDVTIKANTLWATLSGSAGVDVQIHKCHEPAPPPHHH